MIENKPVHIELLYNFDTNNTSIKLTLLINDWQCNKEKKLPFLQMHSIILRLWQK